MSWELPNTSLKSPIRITVSWLAKVSVGIGSSRTGMKKCIRFCNSTRE